MKIPESIERVFGPKSLTAKIAFFLGLAALIAAYFRIILPGLGHLVFWVDEAQTAAIAQNILRDGLPSVKYGPNLLIADAHDLNYLQLEAKHGWLPYYLCALSFRYFGATEFAGRLPFVLIGALVIIATALVGWKLYGKFLGIVAGALLTFQPFFLKHVHQCRYFSPAMLFTVAAVGIFALRGKRPNDRFWPALSLTLFLLFMSFQLYAFVFLFAFMVYEFLGEKTQFRERLRRLLWNWRLTVSISALLMIPWLIFFSMGRMSMGGKILDFRPADCIEQFGICLRTGQAFFPFLFLAGLLPMERSKASYLLPGIVLAALAAMSMVPKSIYFATGIISDRYLLFLFPLGALVAARGLLLLKNPKILLWTGCAMLLLAFVGRGTHLDIAKDSLVRITKINQSFLSQLDLYRDHEQPDPTRVLFEKIKQSSASVKAVYFPHMDAINLLFYMGRDKQIFETPPPNQYRLIRPFLLIGDLYKNMDPAELNGCELQSWEGVCATNYNHAETYYLRWQGRCAGAVEGRICMQGQSGDVKIIPASLGGN